MCHKDKNAVVLGDNVGADSKPVVKKETKSGCCGRCQILGKSAGPATGNGQNENREGNQMLSEVME